MIDPLLSAHDLALVDAVANRVLELLGEREAPPTPSRWLSSSELAALLGRSREWVYDHADELGARRIGSGSRPRLIFDVDQVLSARQSSKGSHLPDPPPAGRSRRRRQATKGSEVRLLPIGGQKRP